MSREVKFDISPFLELESPLKDFGGVEVKNWFSNIVAEVADSPIALSLSKLYENVEVSDKNILNLYSRYNVWLIPNRVKISKRGGITEPVSLGIQVEYRNDELELNRGVTCSIVSLIPAPQYSSVGGIGVDLGGEIGHSGEIEINTDDFEPAKLLLNTGMLKIGSHSNVHAHLKFKFEVTVPVISAVGIGSSGAEWQFAENSGPLYGRDIETWTVLVFPKRKKEITYRIRFYLIMRTAYFKTRRESAWETLTCRLT